MGSLLFERDLEVGGVGRVEVWLDEMEVMGWEVMVRRALRVQSVDVEGRRDRAVTRAMGEICMMRFRESIGL